MNETIKMNCKICNKPINTIDSDIFDNGHNYNHICEHHNYFHQECLNRHFYGKCYFCKAEKLFKEQDEMLSSEVITQKVKDICNYLKVPTKIITKSFCNYKHRIDTIVNYKINKINEINNEINNENSKNSEETHIWKMINDSIQFLTNDDYCFLSVYEPLPNKGYMFSQHPCLDIIEKTILKGYDLHSGSSYGLTLRTIERIIKL